MNYSFSAKEVREELSEQLKEARGQDNVSDIEMIFHVACSFNCSIHSVLSYLLASLVLQPDQRSWFAAVQAVRLVCTLVHQDARGQSC